MIPSLETTRVLAGLRRLVR